MSDDLLNEVYRDARKLAAKQEAPQWLDKPTGDGYWRFNCGGASNIYLVCVGTATLPGESRGTPLEKMPHGWWIPVPDAPAPPPAPLPRSRSVTLTAKVTKVREGSWDTQIYVHNVRSDIAAHRSDYANSCTKEQAMAFAREYGIEPAVEGES